MTNNLGRESVWDSMIWDEIDRRVAWEASRLRVARRVFTGSSDGDGTNVQSGAFDPANMTISEGMSEPFLEIAVHFTLTQSQVDNEASIRQGRTLAGLAAKSVAIAEDKIFFQGLKAFEDEQERERKEGKKLSRKTLQNMMRHIPILRSAPPEKGHRKTLVRVANGNKGNTGLIDSTQNLIRVKRARRDGYGGNTFRSVTQGIARLTRNAQPGPHALLLESKIYADMHTPLGSGSLATTADRLAPLVSGGLYGTGTLPANSGLLISLGGEPTSLYIGREIATAYTHKTAEGNHLFRVFERVKLIVHDPEAVIRLKFTR